MSIQIRNRKVSGNYSINSASEFRIFAGGFANIANIKIGSFWVYLWTNENKPLEPVHASEGRPNENATKIWTTKTGHCVCVTIIHGFQGMY